MRMVLILCVAQLLCVRRIPLEILLLNTGHRTLHEKPVLIFQLWCVGTYAWFWFFVWRRLFSSQDSIGDIVPEHKPQVTWLNTNLNVWFFVIGTCACFWFLSDTDDFPLQACIDLDPPMLPLVQAQFSALQLWRFQANENNLAESSIWQSQIKFTCIPVRLLQSDCS